MRSVLGKLICKELGREKYQYYQTCLRKKQSTEIFCDIYIQIREKDESDKARMLVHLLDTVHQSIRINRHFIYLAISYVAAVAILFFILPVNWIFMTACTLLSISFAVKLVEFVRNRYCDSDIRMILIYKCVLFYLLEEDSGNLS